MTYFIVLLVFAAVTSGFGAWFGATLRRSWYMSWMTRWKIISTSSTVGVISAFVALAIGSHNNPKWWLNSFSKPDDIIYTFKGLLLAFTFGVGVSCCIAILTAFTCYDRESYARRRTSFGSSLTNHKQRNSD